MLSQDTKHQEPKTCAIDFIVQVTYFYSLRSSHSCPATIMYPRVCTYTCTWDMSTVVGPLYTHIQWYKLGCVLQAAMPDNT